MTDLEAIEVVVKQLDFKLEALRWRLEAHARDIATLRERMLHERTKPLAHPLRSAGQP